MNKKIIFLETIKIEKGLIFNLDLHKQRLAETAFAHYKTKPVLNIDINSIPGNLENEKIKCRVLYAEDIISVEFHAYQPKEIRSLQIVHDDNISYNFKYADRSYLNDLLEKRKDSDEIIIVKNGKITDSSYSNLVFEANDGQLFTPKTYLLNGIKRKFLLKKGFISEKDIFLDDLHLYTKVFFINAMLDLQDNISIPISSIKF